MPHMKRTMMKMGLQYISLPSKILYSWVLSALIVLLCFQIARFLFVIYLVSIVVICGRIGLIQGILS